MEILVKLSTCSSLLISQIKSNPNCFCKINPFIYGLKHAPCTWNGRFVEFITQHGFPQGKIDGYLFVYKDNIDLAYLLLYVDDIIVTASSDHLKMKIITALKAEFSMIDMGILNSFLIISVKINNSGLFLNQSKYAEEILLHAYMQNCKSCSTPIDLQSKLAEKKANKSQTQWHIIVQHAFYST